MHIGYPLVEGRLKRGNSVLCFYTITHENTKLLFIKPHFLIIGHREEGRADFVL